MTWEVYYKTKLNKHSKNKNIVSINSRGILYFPNYCPAIERFEILWDRETNRIGIKPNKDGKHFTKVRSGRISTLKKFLDHICISYPQVCEAEWDNDIYAIKVRK